MKILNKLVLTGILAFSPLVSLSPDKFEKVMPLEKKLREIESDKKVISKNICMHKTMRYYINARYSGENVYAIIGHINNSDVLHSWIGIDKKGKTHYIDLTYDIPPMDGFPKEFYNNRKEMWVFKNDFSIEDFINKKNTHKKKKDNIRYVRKNVKNRKTEKKGYKIPLKKSIENYCKQDTAAWKYYQENIAKNNR